MIIPSLLYLVAYLCGSLSSAIIVCKLLSLPDPRKAGSLNPGTTNVLRLGGKFPAALTLLGDFSKGFIPVFIGKLIGLSLLIQTVIGLCAILGHVYPLFYNFKGGKGVATLFGVIFALSWILGILATLTWLSVAIILRYSSLAALIMLILLPCFAFFIIDKPALIPLIIICLFIIWQHRNNIKRLLKGQESKLKF